MRPPRPTPSAPTSSGRPDVPRPVWPTPCTDRVSTGDIWPRVADSSPVTVSRRTLLGATGAAGLVTAAGGYRVLGDRRRRRPPLPAPGKSGIKHVVVVMMENRSFDHFLGWLPTAHGKQAGLSLRRPVRRPAPHPPPRHHRRCGFNDPDHSYEGGRIELERREVQRLAPGRAERQPLDRLLRAGRPGLPRQAVPDWTTFDRYFSAVHGRDLPQPLLPARGAHRPAPQRRPPPQPAVPLPDHLGPADAKGVAARYYFADVPFTAFPVRLKHGPTNKQPFAQFLTDAAAGNLPRSPTSTRASPTRTAASPTTTTRMPTSGPARTS